MTKGIHYFIIGVLLSININVYGKMAYIDKKTDQITGSVIVDANTSFEKETFGQLRLSSIYQKGYAKIQIGELPPGIDELFLVGWSIYPDKEWFNIPVSTYGLQKKVEIPTYFDYDYNIRLFLDFRQECSTIFSGTIDYDISLHYHVFPVRTIVYLLIAWFYAAGMFYFTKYKNLCALADFKLNKYVKSSISFISHLLIGIMLLDETGLLLTEWNLTVGLFSVFRTIIGIPGASQLIFLANLGLMLPATYIISEKLIRKFIRQKGNVEEDPIKYRDFVKRYSMNTALQMFSITTMFFFWQTALWGELGNIAGLYAMHIPINMVFLFGIIIVPGFIIIIRTLRLYKTINEKDNPYGFTPRWELFSVFHSLLIFFLSLTQTIITRVILLLSLIRSGKKIAAGAIGKINKVSGFHYSKSNDEDFDSDVEVLSSNSIWDQLNFLTLTTSTIILLLIFQSSASPFPPTQNAFPKTETISFFYMSFMLLYLIPFRKFKWLKTLLFISYTAFCLYALPVIFPSWFFPVMDEPGFSVFDASTALASIDAVVMFLALFQVYVVFYLLFGIRNWYYMRQKLFENKNVSTFRIKAIIYVILLLNLMLFFYFLLPIIYGLGNMTIFQFLILFEWTGLKFAAIVLIVMITLIVLFLMKFSVEPAIAESKKQLLKVGGHKIILELQQRSKFLSSFKSWNPQRGYRFLIYYFVLGIITYGVFYAGFYLPGYMDSRKQQLIYHVPFDYDIDFFVYNENQFTLGYRNQLNSYKTSDGRLFYHQDISYRNLNVIDNQRVCFVNNDSLWLMDFDKNHMFWSQPVPRSPNNYEAGKIYAYQRIILLKNHDNISLFDLESGEYLNSIKGVTSISKNKTGLLFIVRNYKSIGYVNQHNDYYDLITLNDTIKHLYSNYNHGMAFTRSDTLWLFCADNKGWQNVGLRDYEKINYDHLLATKNYLFISYEGDEVGVQCIDLSAGKEGWFLHEHQPQYVFNHYSHMSFTNNFGIQCASVITQLGLFTRMGDDVFLIDPKEGSVISEHIGPWRPPNGESILLSSVVSDSYIGHFYAGVLSLFDIGSGNRIQSNVISRRILEHYPYPVREPYAMADIITSWAYLHDNTIFIFNATGVYVIELSIKGY